MSEASLAIPFALPSDDDDPWGSLMLEQVPWKPGTGFFTKMDLLKELSNLLYGNAFSYETLCGTNDEDSSYKCIVNAYPNPPSLTYNIGVTHGVIPRIREEIRPVSEALAFNGSDTVTLTYPASDVSYTILNDKCWDLQGADVTPTIVYERGRYKADQKIFCTLLVEYTTVVHVHEAIVFVRELEENPYLAVVWANWQGGVRLLELDEPHGASDDYKEGVDCDGRTGVIIDPDDDDEPLYADRVTKTITYNYCTGEVISVEYS